MDTAQSEICILGSIMVNPEILKTIRAEISPTDFVNQKNRLVYKAILDADARGEEIIPTSICDVLSRHGKLDQAGGGSYIGEILQSVITSTGTTYHVRNVKANRLKKDLLTISDVMIKKSQNGNAQDALIEARELLAKVKTADPGLNVYSLADSVLDVYASLEQKDNRSISTGFTLLDKLIIGWQPGDLIIVAGRPAMGKSILAKEFAEASGVPVLFFSLEMSRDQLIKRQLSTHSGVNYTSIRRANLTADDMDRIKQATDKLCKIPISYSDKSNMSIAEIAATCEAFRKTNGALGMVVIDYLQLIRADGKLEHREREVSQISQRLKTMARDLDVPVICLAQLNRACEIRGGDKKPILSDLRESGSIEQDADTVIFVWREAAYVEVEYTDDTTNAHEATLIVSKGRNTEIGGVRVYFDGAHQRFRNLQPDESEKKEKKLVKMRKAEG
jgi:replicative DNA helicase